MTNDKIIGLLKIGRSYIQDAIDDVTTGVAEGIYDAAENVENLAVLNQHTADIDAAIASLTPAVKPSPWQIVAEREGWSLDGDNLVYRSKPDEVAIDSIPLSEGWEAACKKIGITIWPVTRKKDAYQNWSAHAEGDTPQEAWDAAHDDNIIGEWEDAGTDSFDASILVVENEDGEELICEEE